MCTRGHKDFKGQPREPIEEGGMWYPRCAPAHALPGCKELLDALLPNLGANLRVAEQVPTAGGTAKVLSRLRCVVGCLRYPHMPKVTDVDAR